KPSQLAILTATLVSCALPIVCSGKSAARYGISVRSHRMYPEAQMRIALIRTYQRMIFDDLAHPLGIMALDAYLRTRGYDDIHLFDMRLLRESADQILDRVLPLQPDVIGLSSLTIERDTIHELTALIKARRPQTITVVGGPYGTSSTRTVM